MAAEILARGGARVMVFEQKLNWEKPCGGGVSARALRRYSFLQQTAVGGRPIREIEFLASNGARARVLMREPLVIYSRSRLHRLLLQRAVEAGAEVIPERIIRFMEDDSGCRAESSRASYRSDFAIVAAGARTRLRAGLAGDFRPHDFMQTFGYYLPQQEDLIRVRFFENFEGYAWVFPRSDHLSLGISGRLTEDSMPELRARLHVFMEESGYRRANARVFSHLLPGLSMGSWSHLQLAGEHWALAGDAAGLVDPITGEGIYYAMRSGEILAECLLENTVARYAQRIWNELASDLVQAARLSRLLFFADAAGSSPTTRAVENCRDSSAFIRLTQDLIEGRQTYGTLVPHLVRSLGSYFVESAANRLGRLSFLRRHGPLEDSPLVK
jgi:flavin-dependent dehydrogenase